MTGKFGNCFHCQYHLGQIIQEWAKKICGRQPLIVMKAYGLLEADHTSSNF